MAFFPCIYFSCLSQMAFSMTYRNYRNKDTKEITDLILERSSNREYFFRLIVQLFSVVMQKGLRMIVENPYSMQTFLKSNFILPPTIVDNNRTTRGDYFIKPTAYWFIGCSPTYGLMTEKKPKEVKSVLKAKSASKAGLCSEERSMISPDYARNFICDFILGKEQKNTQLSLFENERL